jgi:hypothetical protein
MRALLIALGLLFAFTSAYAQQQPKLDAPKPKEQVNPQRLKEQEEAYKSSLKRIPVKEGNADPWGEVRSNDGNASAQNRAKKPAQ